MNAIQLNAGVSIENLYSTASKEQIEKIKKLSVDGFTEDELQELQNDGIDVELIKQNSKALEKTEKQGTATQEVVDQKIAELKEKYAVEGGVAKSYKMSNPEVAAFKKAVDEGMLKDLADAGLTKNQIIDVISEVFPNAGIKNQGEDGKYTCPRGQDAEAKELYKSFLSELAQVTKGEGAEVTELRQKLDAISKEIVNNNSAMKLLEVNITMLQDEVEADIKAAIEESKEIADDQKEAANDAVKKNLSAYSSSKGEMSYGDFQKNLSRDLDEVAGTADSKMASVVLKIVNSERKMATLERYMTQMGDLMKKNDELNTEMKGVQEELDKALAADTSDVDCADEVDEDCQQVDPIGFTDGDKRFDFFVDKDDNSDITNENEFLGAENGFDEVKALDTDNDGIVTKEELEKGNVKVVQTNADGTQEIKNVADVLKDGDSIDLNSYEKVGADIGNGNTLQGTFNMNVDGKTLEGYQTLDNINWLDENYEFTDEVEGTGRFAQGEDMNLQSEDYTEKLNAFKERQETLRTDLDSVYDTLELDKAELQSEILEISNLEAKTQADRIKNIFESQKKADDAKAEEAKADEAKADEAKAEEAKAEEAKADEAKAEEDKDKDKDKDKK